METPIVVALIGVVGIVIGLLVQERRYRAAAPRLNAKADIDYQVTIIDGFKASNALAASQTQSLSEAAIANGKQAIAIVALTQANTGLLEKLDGLPKMVGEQHARELVFIDNNVALRAALFKAGVPFADQPVDKIPLPLSLLRPPTLLDDLKRERAAKANDPMDVDALREEIARLLASAKIVEDTNQTSAHARADTAATAKIAAQAQQQTPPDPTPSTALTGSQAESLTKAGENLIEAGKPPPDDKLAGLPGSD